MYERNESAKGRFARVVGCTLLRGVAALGVVLYSVSSLAQVNWKDPLAYEKPRYVPISMPAESAVANKYYVDFSSGSGSTCSSTSPCASLRALIGKPGISGGPAYVYVRGTGAFFLYNDVFYGSPGNEIVIKPWGTSTAVFKTSSGNQALNGSSIHDIIIDGGPDLSINFVSDVYDQYALHILANNVTVYRTQAYATSAAGGSMLFAACDNLNCSNVRFINNEMYACNFASGYQCSAIYWGPGSGGGYTNALIKNNIIRDMGGEGIEINPRVTSSNLEISGNAIHNVGKMTCSGNWQCRPGITMSVQSGGGNNGTVLATNLIWDTGSGCIWDRGGGSPRPSIYYNTCYDYGKGSGGGGPNPQGISGYSNGGTAVIENNIIYATNGTNPFDASAFYASNNLCAAGMNCGTSKQSWSSNTLLSTDQNNSSFLHLASASEARSTGLAISTITVDYEGKARPPYDIGAYVYGSSTAAATPPAPTNVRVISP